METWIGIALASALPSLALAIMTWVLKKNDVVTVLVSQAQGQEKNIQQGATDRAELRREIEGIRRMVSEMNAKMAQDYVHRNDWVRMVATIDRKLDKLYERLNPPPS